MSDFRPNRPKDERDILNLPKPENEVKIEERHTIRSEASSMQLERIGMSHEGSDGKRYIGSMAVHIYEVPKLLGMREHVFLFHTTDLTQIPETVAALALPEMGRAVMTRYGRKPPASLLDKYVEKSDTKV